MPSISTSHDSKSIKMQCPVQNTFASTGVNWCLCRTGWGGAITALDQGEDKIKATMTIKCVTNPGGVLWGKWIGMLDGKSKKIPRRKKSDPK